MGHAKAIIMVLFAAVFASFAADTVIVDGLIVWSIQADEATDMNKVADFQINSMNKAMQNSNIAVKINCVYKGKIDYDEGTISSAYSHQYLKRGSNGLGVVHELRDKYGADLICLICVNSGVIGRSNGWDNDGPDPGNCYTTLRLRYNTEWPLLSHEWGHNLGCGHETGGLPAYSYSHGYVFDVNGSQRRTIMVSSFNPDRTILYYSSPDIKYQGVTIGIADKYDNARTIRKNAPFVAQYRTSSTQPVIAYHKVLNVNHTVKVRSIGTNGIQLDNAENITQAYIYNSAGRLIPSQTIRTGSTSLHIQIQNLSTQPHILRYYSENSISSGIIKLFAER
jgi:hypothetical protein